MFLQVVEQAIAPSLGDCVVAADRRADWQQNAPQVASEMAAPTETRTPAGTEAATLHPRVRMEAGRQGANNRLREGNWEERTGKTNCTSSAIPSHLNVGQRGHPSRLPALAARCCEAWTGPARVADPKLIRREWQSVLPLSFEAEPRLI